MRIRAIDVAAAALVAIPVASAAGQAPGDSIMPRDSAARLEPIRVVAPRIAGLSSAAPYAVAVRTTSSLPDGTPAMALDESLHGIPGVQVDNRFNYALGERISVRGAGARAQFGVRGVRVIIDGIPATLPDGQTTLNQIDLTRIARVEVVRGPVASLYGNAGGGAILIETSPPPDGPIGGTARVTTGSNGLLRTMADAGGTRGAVAFDASISRVGYDGFRSHSSATNHYGSAQVRWRGQRDFVRASIAVVDYDALNPGSLSDSLLRADRRQAFRNNVLQRTGETGAQQQAGVQWQRNIADDYDLEVATWGIMRTIDNPIPGRVVVVDRVAGGARALLRGAIRDVAWTAGLEHERQRDDRQNFANTSGEHGALLLDQYERVTGLGAFAQASIPVHARVTVLGGVRHDRTEFRADDRFTANGDPDDSGTRTLGAFSPSAGISLRFDGNVLLYANAGTAFETPTTTELVNRPDGAGGFNPSLAPQRTVSYEVGARRGGVRGNAQLALYRALVRDALIPFEVPDAPGRQFYRNAGRTATSGAEAAATTHLTAALRVDAAYTFTSARFRDYSARDVQYSGRNVPGVAPHRADLSATYSRGPAFFAADLRSQSRMAVDDANSAHSPGFALADIRVGATTPGRNGLRATVTGGVQNAFASAYNSSVVVNAFGRRFFEPGPGRTFHVGAAVTAGSR